MIIGLVAFQALILLLWTLAEPLRARPSLQDWLAAEQAGQLLAPSITRSAAGTMVFVPTPEMTAYMAQAPAFWFFATDGDMVIRGGAPKDLDTKSDRGPSSMLRGATTLLHTRAGPVGLLLGGQQGDLLDGIRAWLSHRLRRWLLAVALIALGTTALTVGLVHLLLRPVRLAARAAAALEPGRHAPALPETGVPAEILPLVTATNAAFDRLEQEHERQRRFIANAAHELRTPITILGIRLDELPEGPARQKLRQDVQRLTLLANQLLDLGRLQHAGPRHDRQVDLVALARDAVAEMGPLAIDHGSSLAFHTERPRWEIRGDEQALRGVFLNLLGNALAHGGKAVKVELRIGAEGSIEVADCGVGIPAEARGRVFEAFERAGGGAGSGLGLYIVREVLRAHGATIELRDGRPGAVFRIRF
ncbi:sensor histidine kinase [Siccirubricoccus phaeus]|uniref:sensor histidine kinase n=1 Tax=Siccirubricoccus phaeus TaxID=2595053 RepID=UPI0011F1F7D2|nr:HAMP domain-containing sensor histidine kinase [Siccirubricoccus phaeus]